MLFEVTHPIKEFIPFNRRGFHNFGRCYNYREQYFEPKPIKYVYNIAPLFFSVHKAYGKGLETSKQR